MGRRVSEKIWDAKSGRAIGHSHEALQANRYLDSVVTRINTIYYRLCEQSEAVTAQMARDVFVFCCFTGFDYSTTASLTEQNLVLADDGSMWIETHRVKTGVASKVKLLDIPLSILKKYESITPYSTRSITLNRIIALCGALTPF